MDRCRLPAIGGGTLAYALFLAGGSGVPSTAPNDGGRYYRPGVPFVPDVTDEVTLTLDFAATAA